jgi:hypothetical protein
LALDPGRAEALEFFVGAIPGFPLDGVATASNLFGKPEPANARGSTVAYAETRKPTEAPVNQMRVNGAAANDAERLKLRDLVTLWRREGRIFTAPAATQAEKDAAKKQLLKSGEQLRPFDGGFQKVAKGVDNQGQSFGPADSKAQLGTLDNLPFALGNGIQLVGKVGGQTMVVAGSGASVKLGAAQQAATAFGYSLDPFDLTWGAFAPTVDFVLDPALAIQLTGVLPGFAIYDYRISFLNSFVSEDPFEEQLELATLLLDLSILVTTDGVNRQLDVLVDIPGDPSAASSLETFILDHFVEAGGLFTFDMAPPMVTLGVDGAPLTTRFFVHNNAGVSSVPEPRAFLALGLLLLAWRRCGCRKFGARFEVR